MTAGNDGKQALSSSADWRGSRPKASERAAKAMIALLYSIRTASSLQCSPPALCATLSAPPQVSARGCGALSILTPFPFSSTSTRPLFFPSLLTLRQVALALPLYLLLFAKRKAKMPQHATCIAQHALSNTSCATQTQHALPSQDAAAGGASA